MGSDFNKDVGIKLFNARKNLNMTRAELGKIINLHESTIKRYEDGEIKSLDIEKLKEFAAALNLDPAYLMGWEEKTETPKLDEYQDKNKILFSKFEKLNESDKKIIEDMIKRFEKETQD